MTTVPNWIAKGYAYSEITNEAFRITRWRATPTMVVVDLEGEKQRYFALSDLRGRRGTVKELRLVAPDDPCLKGADDVSAKFRIIAKLRDAINDARGLDSSMSPDDLACRVGRLQCATTKAMADLADLL